MRISRVARGIVNTKLFKYPFYCHFYVTRRCNFRCKMCNVWTHGDRKGEMNLDQIKRAADILEQLHVPNIVVSGGEPFMRRDLPDIIKVFSDRGFSIRLQTNGSSQIDRLEEVIEAGINDINISFHSLDPEKHEFITGIKGSWESAYKSLKHAVKRMPKSMVAAATTVSDLNIDEFEDIVKFVNDLGAFSIPIPLMQPTDSSSDEMYRAKSNDLLPVTHHKNELNRVFREIKEYKENGSRVAISYNFLDDFCHILQNGDMRWKCDAGLLYFLVLPDGSLSPCNEIQPRYNILNDDFPRTFWKKRYRDEMTEIQDNCVGCMHACWRDVSYLFRSNRILLERIHTYLTTNLNPLKRS
jgi:MoaA/NifB/PqqE/SkfB family radical SAM enzyme